MLAGTVILATFHTSILSGVFGMAGGLILMGVFAWLSGYRRSRCSVDTAHG